MQIYFYHSIDRMVHTTIDVIGAPIYIWPRAAMPPAPPLDTQSVYDHIHKWNDTGLRGTVAGLSTIRLVGTEFASCNRL